MIKTYVAFDLETTGLDLENDEIIEIGALKVIDGKVADRFMEFVKPIQPISQKITEITGISNDMVAKARNTEAIIREFVQFCEDYILIGHNIMFDYKFSKKYARQYGLAFEKKGIDTLKIACKIHKEFESKSLGALCEHYHVVNQSAHRAYHDALATAKVYQSMAHYYEAENEALFAPIQLVHKEKKVQPATDKQKKYLESLCRYHRLPRQNNLDEMTRSEASKIIDGIISDYGNIQYER